jgi:outer membrane usher protein
VGTDATVLLGGVLQTADGVPVPLQAGEVAFLEEPTRKPQLFFTNRKGRFRVEGLKPGRYAVQTYADPQATIYITIPEGQLGLYDIGPLKLPPSVQR